MLEYYRLNLDRIITFFYVESSFNNVEPHNSELPYILCHADDTWKCSIINYASIKFTRLTRSSMAGDALALVDGYDQAFLIKHDMENML